MDMEYYGIKVNVESICWRCGTINPLLGGGDWCYKCAHEQDEAKARAILAEKEEKHHNWKTYGGYSHKAADFQFNDWVIAKLARMCRG